MPPRMRRPPLYPGQSPTYRTNVVSNFLVLAVQMYAMGNPSQRLRYIGPSPGDRNYGDTFRIRITSLDVVVAILKASVEPPQKQHLLSTYEEKMDRDGKRESIGQLRYPSARSHQFQHAGEIVFWRHACRRIRVADAAALLHECRSAKPLQEAKRQRGGVGVGWG